MISRTAERLCPGPRSQELRTPARAREWTGEQLDGDLLEREISSGLWDRTTREVVGVTGLSQHYCSLIRLGKKVPHVQHWTVLRTLTIRDGPCRPKRMCLPQTRARSGSGR